MASRFGEHRYRVEVTWEGNRGSGTSGVRDYDRRTSIRVDGKPTLAASADVPFRGEADRHNPEDLLLAALAQCHLLSFLYAATTLGIVVEAYDDGATALLRQEGNGGRFEEAVLHPRVTVRDAEMVDRVTEAHRLAHEWCFIANSVNFDVRIEPTTRVADPA